MAKERFPKRRFYGELMQTMMHGLESMRDIQNRQLDEDGYTGRRLLGFKLPVWQRREKWDDEQCIHFIESVWLGVGIGTFMVNYERSGRNSDAHLVLLDGQQRLRAIERYWADEFAIPGEDGNHYRWSELSQKEQAQFYRIPFPWLCTSYDTDEQLKDAYNRHNFGGTPHTPDERA